MKKIILLTLVYFSGISAFADQCAYITKSEAKMAVNAILESQTVQSLCEPCGEKKAQVVQVDIVSLRKVEATNYFEVVVNEHGIDLAYTYVNGLNLAKLVGCNAEGVSSSIK